MSIAWFITGFWSPYVKVAITSFPKSPSAGTWKHSRSLFELCLCTVKNSTTTVDVTCLSASLRLNQACWQDVFVISDAAGAKLASARADGAAGQVSGFLLDPVSWAGKW